MVRRINEWLHRFADYLTGRTPVALEGFGPIRDVGTESVMGSKAISHNQVDLGGWHVILVSTLEQAKSAMASLDMKCVVEREILPLGERGYLIRWK